MHFIVLFGCSNQLVLFTSHKDRRRDKRAGRCTNTQVKTKHNAPVPGEVYSLCAPLSYRRYISFWARFSETHKETRNKTNHSYFVTLFEVVPTHICTDRISVILQPKPKLNADFQ